MFNEFFYKSLRLLFGTSFMSFVLNNEPAQCYGV